MSTAKIQIVKHKVRAPAEGDMLAVADTPLDTSSKRPSCWLVGTHGGAGVTTLAHTLAPLGDAGQVIPAANDPATVVLVCANHMEGLVSAHRAISQFGSDHAGGADLLGLVIVETTPPIKDRRLRKQLADRRGVLEAAAPQVWTVPYLAHWQVMRTSELPVWTPRASQQDSDKKKKKNISAAEAVPDEVATIGQKIHSAAVDLYRELHS